MYVSCAALKLLTGQQLAVVAYLLLALSLRLAEAIECNVDGDCANRDKICHENRCICARDRPIEDQDRCLSLSLIGETCALAEQCLGNSLCVDGICSCGNEAISLYNPSSKIFYCHPKRRLNEECNYDSQCPSNSYCSTSKFGCLCQNGFAPATVTSSETGSESLECLAKFCTNSSSCESEFHQCEDNKCKCLATHFDPETAKCYRFGSTGGKSAEELLQANETAGNITDVAQTGGDDSFYSIMKDLRENSDRMWPILIILISLSILLLALIFMLIRKHYLGYCWTAHKKEYQPNTKKAPKNGYFNKNSINNKSFRQKNGETEDDINETDSVADKSSLVSGGNSTINNNNSNKSIASKTRAPASSVMTTTSKDKNMHHNYVKVNINETTTDTSDPFNNDNRQYFQQQQQVVVNTGPLKSSTSTPV